MLTHVKYGMGAARNELSELSWRSGRSRRWEKPGVAMKLSFGIEHHRSPLIIANLRSAKKSLSWWVDIPKSQKIQGLNYPSGWPGYLVFPHMFPMIFGWIFGWKAPFSSWCRKKWAADPHQELLHIPRMECDHLAPKNLLGSPGFQLAAVEAIGIANAGWWLSHLSLLIIYC